MNKIKVGDKVYSNYFQVFGRVTEAPGWCIIIIKENSTKQLSIHTAIKCNNIHNLIRLLYHD